MERFSSLKNTSVAGHTKFCCNYETNGPIPTKKIDTLLDKLDKKNTLSKSTFSSFLGGPAEILGRKGMRI